MSTILVWLAGCILLQASVLLADNNPTVDTRYGYIEGFEEQVGSKILHIFLGVPYAKPPTGNLRFKRPEGISPWKGVKTTTAFKPSCIQLDQPELLPGMKGVEGMEMFNPDIGLSEDCLYVNIWKPADASLGPRATLVWIHGGGFTRGATNVAMYDGKKLASSQDVIIVSMNYRLGPLGFLYNGKDQAPGNVGLLDQQMALHWVRDNIAAFGGDPSRITIFGESAGSASVSFHLLAEGSHSLFSNAILQSAVATGFWAFKSEEVAKGMSDAVAKALNCTDADDMDCLLQLDAEAFSKLPAMLTCPPTLDGHFIQETPKDILESGKAKKTNVIIGFNKNEGTLFAPFAFPQWVNTSDEEILLTEDQFNTMVEVTLLMQTGKNDSVLTQAVGFQYKMFNWPRTSDYFHLYDQIMGDALINCDSVDFANRYAANGGRVYMYLLEHRPVNSPTPEWMGANHGLDIVYVFGNTKKKFTLTAEEEQLSNNMMTYWTNLAKTGNPEGTSLPAWPLYNADGGIYLPFNIEDTTPREGLKARECDFWNNYMPKLISQLDNYCAGDTSRQK